MSQKFFFVKNVLQSSPVLFKLNKTCKICKLMYFYTWCRHFWGYLPLYVGQGFLLFRCHSFIHFPFFCVLSRFWGLIVGGFFLGDLCAWGFACPPAVAAAASDWLGNTQRGRFRTFCGSHCPYCSSTSLALPPPNQKHLGIWRKSCGGCSSWLLFMLQKSRYEPSAFCTWVGAIEDFWNLFFFFPPIGIVTAHLGGG